MVSASEWPKTTTTETPAGWKMLFSPGFKLLQARPAGDVHAPTGHFGMGKPRKSRRENHNVLSDLLQSVLLNNFLLNTLHAARWLNMAQDALHYLHFLFLVIATTTTTTITTTPTTPRKTATTSTTTATTTTPTTTTSAANKHNHSHQFSPVCLCHLRVCACGWRTMHGLFAVKQVEGGICETECCTVEPRGGVAIALVK